MSGAVSGGGADGAPLTVDARGLRCPLPVIRLAEAARAAGPGARILLLATDPAAEHDIAAWCRMRGAVLEDRSAVDSGVDFEAGEERTAAVVGPAATAYLVRVGSPQPPGSGRASASASRDA